MLTLKLINEETERVIRGLEKKHFKGAAEAIAAVQATDRQRREAQQQLDYLLSESKKKAAEIGGLMKQGLRDEAEKAKAAEIAAMEKARAETEAAKESTRKLAEENKQAWQTVKQEVKSAETETKAFDSSYGSLQNSLNALENKMLKLPC